MWGDIAPSTITYINLSLLGMCKGIAVLDTVSDFLNPKGNFCFHNKIRIYLFGEYTNEVETRNVGE